jgi:signal transduction histidine kinase/ActR/RegA family two-component response regulator
MTTAPMGRDSPDDVEYLRGCIRDLVALSTWRAMRPDGEPRELAANVLDVLRTMLRLELGYLRLHDPTDGGRSIECAFAESAERVDPQDVGRMLAPRLAAGGPEAVEVASPAGGDPVRVVVVGVGVDREHGVIVAGAARPEFPREFERVLLSVAANQVAIALQGSRVLAERERVARALQESEERLRGEREVVETIHVIGRAISAELDLQKLAQALTDATTKLSGARFGAFFYNVADRGAASSPLYALSGTPRDAFASFAALRSTRLFGSTFRGTGVVRLHDVTRDPRFAHDAPSEGAPLDHLPFRSYLAVPVVSRSREVLGGLFFAHPEPAMFTERHERLVVGLAAQAASAMDNARLYEAERTARAAAETANRAKDQFLASVSHELRNPLGPILAWSHLLRTGRLDDVASEKALDVIERSARAQAQLVDDLLDVSRIVSGKLRLDVHPVEIGRVAASAAESVRPSADAKQIRLEVEGDPPDTVILGDPDRLQQVIWNLLSNAIKFTPRGGRVQMAVRRSDGQLELAVRDTGDGIRKDFLPYVFQRFEQGDATTTRRHGGLGLGLAIVRHIVELHGGTVAARSDGPGRGSEFTITLPVHVIATQPQPAPDATAAARSSAARAALVGTKVLVVDDDPSTNEVVSALLASAGAEVRVAGSAAQALDALGRWTPDVLVSDIAMPDEDGYALISKLRARPANEGGAIPAVALTAYARIEDRVRVLASGFQAYVTKPMDPQELIDVVAKLPGRERR